MEVIIGLEAVLAGRLLVLGRLAPKRLAGPVVVRDHELKQPHADSQWKLVGCQIRRVVTFDEISSSHVDQKPQVHSLTGRNCVNENRNVFCNLQCSCPEL